MEVIGTVVRLQVQTDHLKPRPSGSGHYDPTPLREVPWLELSPVGCTAPEGLLDLHHADHPQTRNVRGVNGVSLLPQAHYEGMRARYGEHLADGVAGENLLLATDGPWTEQDLRAELLLEVDGGTLVMTDPMAAPPCVEFSRWCLGRQETGPLTAGVDDDVAAALEHLGSGTRGFYLRPGGSGLVRPGARLLRA